MTLSNERIGPDHLVAVKQQSSKGTAETSFSDSDIIRKTGGPAVEFGTQEDDTQGLTGKNQKLDTAVDTGIESAMNMTVRPGPDQLDVFVRNLLQKGPDSNSPDTWNTDPQSHIDTFLTVLKDTGHEGLRLTDAWTRSISLSASAGGILSMQVQGPARKAAERLSSETPLTDNNRQLGETDEYAFKDFTFKDQILSSTVDIVLTGITINFEQEISDQDGNAVEPRVFTRDGNFIVNGSLEFDVYADTSPFLDRILSETRSDFKAEFVSGDGKTFSVYLYNCKLTGNPPAEDGSKSKSQASIDFEARMSTDYSQNAYKIEIEK